MLARRLTTILPAMTLAEAIETTRIQSVAGLTGDRIALVTTRPCRAPHHTISDVGLIGGGHVPMPGDVSRAHYGVLFWDERPECRRHGLEGLRQPLEKSVICIQSRVPPRPYSSDHVGSSVPVKSSSRAAQTCGISRHLRTLLLARSLVEAEYAAAEARSASFIIVICGGEGANDASIFRLLPSHCADLNILVKSEPIPTHLILQPTPSGPCCGTLPTGSSCTAG
jgi:hypothetical protein